MATQPWARLDAHTHHDGRELLGWPVEGSKALGINGPWAISTVDGGGI